VRPYLPVPDAINAPNDSRQLQRYVRARSAHFTSARRREAESIFACWRSQATEKYLDPQIS